MPFVPAANTAEFELIQTLDGQRLENTLYGRTVAPWTAAQISAVCDSLAAWWTANMRPLLSDQIELVAVEGTSLESATAPVGANTTGTPSIGALDESIPNNCSLAISFRTALRGRSFRGRNYIAGIPVASVLRSHVEPGLVDSITAAYNALPDAFSDGLSGALWVVVSRFSGVDVDGRPIPRVTAVTTPITGAHVVDDVIDSQRRRLPGRGD